MQRSRDGIGPEVIPQAPPGRLAPRRRRSMSVDGRRGSTTVNEAPAPGMLWTLMRPPSALTSSFVIQRPSPAPEYWRSSAARSKRRKIRLWSAGEMPMPWSRTVSRTTCSSPSTPISTGAPAPYFSALPIRLVDDLIEAGRVEHRDDRLIEAQRQRARGRGRVRREPLHDLADERGRRRPRPARATGGRPSASRRPACCRSAPTAGAPGARRRRSASAPSAAPASSSPARVSIGSVRSIASM